MSELKKIVFDNTSDKDICITKFSLDGEGILTFQFGNLGDPCMCVCAHSERPFGEVVIDKDIFEWPEKL